ncbi:hypothetical protein D9756_005190 [Leucocoprinus leucothites]|uniref:Uncharacterized protein n=1 Tax=Leucocoprinus leucothites TaxID=201217 RepID=A0A8H5G9L3_9AGAR|nr:hypothetical protein D9756_005190 [Leucoagaricus leucothites]
MAFLGRTKYQPVSRLFVHPNIHTELEPQLSTAKRQRLTQFFTNGVSHAAPKPQLFDAPLTHLQLPLSPFIHLLTKCAHHLNHPRITLSSAESLAQSRSQGFTVLLRNRTQSSHSANGTNIPRSCGSGRPGLLGLMEEIYPRLSSFPILTGPFPSSSFYRGTPCERPQGPQIRI